MGQLLFQYMFNPILETVNQFQYHWEKTTEYGLYYQRYAALSDASIFDAPVAITKVATGVSRIQDLFLDKQQHPGVFSDSLIFKKAQKDVKYVSNSHLISRKISPLYYQVSNLFGKRSIVPNKDTFDGILVYNRRDDRHLLLGDDYYANLALRTNILSIYSDIFLNDVTWKHLSYFDSHILDKEWILNNSFGFGEQISPPQTWNDLNLYDTIAMRLPDNIFSVKEDFMAWIDGPVGDIYYTEAIKRINDDRLNVYQIQYALEIIEAGWKIYPQEFMKLKFDRHMNVYENIYGTPDRKDICLESFQRFGKIPRKDVIWYENVQTYRIEGPVNFIDDVFAKRDVYELDINQSVELSSNSKDVNIASAGIFGGRPLVINFWEEIYCRKDSELQCTVFDFYNLTSQERVLSRFQTVSLTHDKRNVYFQWYGPAGSKTSYRGILSYAVNHGKKFSHQAITHDYILSGHKTDTNSQTALCESVWGIKSIYPVCELDLNTFAISYKRDIFTVNGVQCVSIDKSIDVGSYLGAYKFSKNVMTDNLVGGTPIDKYLSQFNQVFANKDRYDLSLNDYFQYGAERGENSRIGWYDNDIFGFKDRLSLDVLSQVWTSSPIKRLSDSIKVDIFGSKEKKEISAFNDAGVLFGYKQYVFFGLWNNVMADKSKKEFSIQDSAVNIFNEKHGFVIDATIPLSGNKVPKDFLIEDSSTVIHKESKEMYFEIAHLWFAYKSPKDFIIMPWDLFPDKVKKDMSIQDYFEPITKKRKGIPDTDLIVSAIKSAFSFVVTSSSHPPIWEEIGGFIVPISKVRKGLMDREIDELVSKRFKDVLISKGSFASVIAEDLKTTLDSGLTGLEKLPHSVFLEYQNLGIIKSKIHGAIHDDYVTLGKLAYYGMLTEGVWTSKGSKLLQVQPQIHLYKKKYSGSANLDGVWLAQGIKRLSVFEQMVSGVKKPLVLDVFEQENAIKEISYANIFKEYWLEKLPYLCYYSYGEWLKKDIGQGMIHEDEFAFKKQYGALLNLSTPIIRKELKAWYEDYIVGDRIIREGQLAAEIEWFEKIRHKCGIHPNDFGNWAWVYENPDPFRDTFGIDELLLPENDTHYENFKELIFDSHYMRPRKPIKEISDTQWIAQYPIKHPTPKWSDVAIDYDASAIDWQNYYGIETSIMHDMFLRYYRIWNAKMFEFSTMTMQQSVNLMLEYMWAWIPEYFPVDKLEEAYRVFKLIRWFGEAAIINNSQYIISYEYDNGGMKMKEDPKTHKKVYGVYGIEVNLKDCSPISNNDTMFLDRTQFVIRNNPVYTGKSWAYVEFIFTAKRNTTVSFRLMNTVGCVNIYVDGELIDTRYKTGDVIIPIQYTGDEVTIRVEKDKNNNLNDQFMIGNLIIPQQDFKDLTIEFDPQLRAGNKPLNEIAEKLIAYAQLHDQRDTAWSEALKANLGVSEVYKRMTRYWDDHHAGKIKGKRLTIKQV